MLHSTSGPFPTTSPYVSQDRGRVVTSMTSSPYGASPGSGNTNYVHSSGVPSSSLNESLSRPQYQPGYLLSLVQSQPAQQGSLRHDDPHLIPIRAKINPSFPRNTSSEFGMESIFESAKHRQHEELDDEDGPPRASVNDLVSDVYVDPHKIRQSLFSTPSRKTMINKTQTDVQSQSTQLQTLFVVVFGYPTTRLSPTAAHFQSCSEGGTTDIEVSAEVENAFKIGFRLPWEAARALRKNGEIISGEGGRWIVGVKWADPIQAEQVLGHMVTTFSNSPSDRLDAITNMDSPDPIDSQVLRATSLPHPPPSTIGTPIKLAPSASAFRRGEPEARKENSSIHRIHDQGIQSSGLPSKGVFGQVTDMIFGW